MRASTHEFVYILLVSDAVVYVPWQPSEIQNLPKELRGREHIAFYRPIQMFDDRVAGFKAEFTREPSSSAVEGVPLAVQPKLRLTDGLAKPVAGAACIAMLVSKNGETFPSGHQFLTEGGRAKRLVRPVSAHFGGRFAAPSLDEESALNVTLTDQNGELEYEGLAFGVRGNIGDQSEKGLNTL